MFPANGFERADKLETGGAMHADRCRIGAVADDGDHLPEATRGCLADQGVQQLPANTHAFHRGVDIDRVLDCCAIGRAGAVSAGIGVSSHFAFRLGDEIGKIALDQKTAALRHCFRRWRIDLETGAAMQDCIPVDFSDGWDIRLFTGADQKAGSGGRGHSLVLRIIYAGIVHCGAVKIKII